MKLILKTEHEKDNEQTGHLEEGEQQELYDYRKKYLSECVNGDLFVGVKFIYNESDLSIDGEIAARIFKKLQINEDKKKRYWETNMDLVRRLLGKKRNNTCMQLKDALEGERKKVNFMGYDHKYSHRSR